MEKNIKDYLHYYLGSADYSVRYVDYDPGVWTLFSKLTPDRYLRIINDAAIENIQLRLRKLESLTEDEAEDLARLETPKFRWDDIEILNIKPTEIHFMDGSKWYGDGVEEYNDCYVNLTQLTPAAFHYLLSKGFDLFGLLDSGLAIEKQPTTLNQGV